MRKNLPSLLGPRPRRRLIVLAALAIVLLSINAGLVDQQNAPATGHPTPPVDGELIHFTEDGPRDAPALVLIHGFTGSTRSWDLLVPSLTRNYHIIRIDLLGHGRSAKPAGTGYAIADQGRRIGKVLDGLGVGHAIVVGHSTGGSVATALAEQRRDLVTALAFIDTGPRRDAFIPQGPIAGLLETPVVGQLLWRLRTDSLIRAGAATAVTRDVAIPQAIVDDVRGMTYHAFTATDRAAADYLQQRPVPDRLVALGKPLLVIFGSRDRRWQSSSAADYRVVPGAQIELLPGVGHSPTHRGSTTDRRAAPGLRRRPYARRTGRRRSLGRARRPLSWGARREHGPRDVIRTSRGSRRLRAPAKTAGHVMGLGNISTVRCSRQGGDDTLLWDVARPRRPSRVAGVTMAGFRDRGMAPLGTRLVPHPAVTLVLDFGTGSVVVDDADGRQHRGSLVAGLGLPGAVQVRGTDFESVQVRLSPVIARTVLGVSLDELNGAVVALSDLWGREVPRIDEQLHDVCSWDDRFALTDALIARRFAAASSIDPEVAWAWRRIVLSRGLVRVEELAADTGWSRKRLWSRFHSQMGLPPKRAAKLVRFDHAAHRLAGGCDAARVAADGGYTDQSHLHRDVMAFTGATPATLAREPFLAVDGIAWAGQAHDPRVGPGQPEA
jgi:pimeloyl-ACP methyl ester carboxylesterase/AraC-like DNA-binding protein